MIDLHLHTTASDGRCTPRELVERVRAAGIHTFGVTDHDTVAALDETAALATEAGLRFVPGVEITAVHEGRDVHVLGYFVDAASASLRGFLDQSLADRMRRATLMARQLEALGVPIDIDRIVAENGGPNSGKAIARPVIARALVDAGHVGSVQEAFDRFLAEGQPAYFGRVGASPVEVVGIIARAGGLSSFAHPGVAGRDELIEPLVDAGLGAIEAYHSEHTPEETARYVGVARRYGLAVSGGSDFHGPGTRRSERFGTVALPPEEFDALVARHARVVREGGAERVEREAVRSSNSREPRAESPSSTPRT